MSDGFCDSCGSPLDAQGCFRCTDGLPNALEDHMAEKLHEKMQEMPTRMRLDLEQFEHERELAKREERERPPRRAAPPPLPPGAGIPDDPPRKGPITDEEWARLRTKMPPDWMLL